MENISEQWLFVPPPIASYEDIFEGAKEFVENNPSPECPECQCELTPYYEWDVLQYLCENCEILINKSVTVKEES